MGRFEVIEGRVEDVLPTLDAASFDAVICDPPYGYTFMGAEWDKGVPPAPVWRELARALRPGAHVLAAGGTRTYHRLACAIEDGGLTIRDCVGYAWVYSTGFPKSLDISKALDKAAGAKRSKVVGTKLGRPGMARDGSNQRSGFDAAFGGQASGTMPTDILAPATPDAAAWQGQGTALAPAWEPFVLAMAPLEGTFVENARKHGVAGLNIDGSRIPGAPGLPGNKVDDAVPRDRTAMAGPMGNVGASYREAVVAGAITGRFPKNLILDEGAGALLDAKTGDRKSGAVKGGKMTRGKEAGALGAFAGYVQPSIGASTGGASRFFYCPKASTKERQEGLPDGVKNGHPTLKPIALCRYLAGLLLPPDTGRPRRLLVPFSGAGSEMIGALLAGWDEVVGVEMAPDFAAIARLRIAHWTRDDASPPAAQIGLPGAA
jgi:site-specific DNA-methyltransferase (adenine-specific)